ncbi:MAG: hypothetical protein H6825_08075 [Planctomycetes bacterium]|nr:hypothetical protein [Planctomycetota bacterium]
MSSAPRIRPFRESRARATSVAGIAGVACGALVLALAGGCETPARDVTSQAAPTTPAAPTIPAADAADFTPDELRSILRMSPLPPPPADPTNAYADDPRAARLGQALFFDARLSADGRVACASCHAPDQGWSDGRGRARGVDIADFSAPTLLDVAQQRWFFWDGRSDALWNQALFPLENPKEHGADRLLVAHVVHDDPALRRAYVDVFGALPPLDDGARFPARARPVPDAPDDPLDVAWRGMHDDDRAAIDRVFANVGKAFEAYERQIRPGESPLDRFVRGLRTGDPSDLAALDADAVAGLRLFVGRGRCSVCHGGPTLSDLEFHDVRLHLDTDEEALVVGRAGAFRSLRTNPFGGGGAFSDDPAAGHDKVDPLVPAHELYGAFKTPSLRNVARTAPYMHRGQLPTLEAVVEHYSRMDQGNRAHRGQHAAPRQEESILMPLALSADETRGLLAFLRSLTGDEVDPALRGPPPGFEVHPPSTVERALADFERISARAVARTSPAFLLGLDPRLDRPLVDAALHDQALAVDDPSRALLALPGVEALTPAEASTLARFDGLRLALPGLLSLDVPLARTLATFGTGRPEVELFLDGVATLDAEAAAALADFGGARLSLGGLRVLDVASARTLASYQGLLVLNGMFDIPPDVALALAQPTRTSARRGLALDGPRRIDVALARALGAFRGGTLSLAGVEELEPDQVAALAPARAARLRLDSVRTATPEIVDALCRVSAETVSLRGLYLLDPALRARLAAAPAVFLVGED